MLFCGYTKQKMSANYLLLSCSLPQHNSTRSSVNKRLPSLGARSPTPTNVTKVQPVYLNRIGHLHWQQQG